MTLKQKIQSDFIAAMKAGDQNAKAALSSVKAKITEAEKAKNNTELTDTEVIGVLSTAIKQRKQSYEAFTVGKREELARKEYDEMLVLERYMPAQMTEVEVKAALTPIIESLKGSGLPEKAIIGRAMGEFNKSYKGQADAMLVKNVLESMIQ